MFLNFVRPRGTVRSGSALAFRFASLLSPPEPRYVTCTHVGGNYIEMESLLKIVYLNGEFVAKESSIFGVSLDTIFTVGTTLLIFFLSYYINKKIEQKKETNRLNELEEYFITLLELLEKPITKQRDYLIEFTRQLKQKKEQHGSLTDVTSLRVDLIREIDNKDLYSIFIKRKKGLTSIKTELFEKLRGQIEYIGELRASIKFNFEEMIRKTEKYEHLFKENIKITNEAFDNMVSSNRQRGIPNNEDQFLISLDKIRVDLMALGEDGTVIQDRYVLHPNYLNPVKELCKNNIHDERAGFILKHISESLYAFDNLEEVKYVYRKHFLLDARGLQKSLTDIRTSRNSFEKM